MIRIEDDCCGCPSEKCSAMCEKTRVPHYYCDICGDEYERDELREIGERHIYKDCYTEDAMERAAKAAETAWENEPCL